MTPQEIDYIAEYTDFIAVILEELNVKIAVHPLFSSDDGRRFELVSNGLDAWIECNGERIVANKTLLISCYAFVKERTKEKFREEEIHKLLLR